MRRLIALVLLALGLLVAASATASASPVEVQLPLGRRIRADRPLTVRVIGGADRVRTSRGPWAAPRGVGGDEFVLPAFAGAAGSLELEVERAGAVDVVAVAVEVVATDTPRVLAMGPEMAPAGAIVLDAADVERLPSVAEAWLQFDDVVGTAERASPEVRRGLATWRERLRGRGGAVAGGGFVPLLHAPGPAVFDVTASAAAAAPRVGDDVRYVTSAVALLVLLLLPLTAASRSGASGASGASALRRCTRAAWIAVPPLLAALWLVAGARLPGDVLASAVVLDGPDDRLVVLRLDARQDAHVSLELPADARGAALFAYDADDASIRSAVVGPTIHLPLRAGEYRVLGYHMVAPPSSGAPAAAPQSAPAAAATRWIEQLGLRVAESRPERAPPTLPSSASFRATICRVIGVGDGN